MIRKASLDHCALSILKLATQIIFCTPTWAEPDGTAHAQVLINGGFFHRRSAHVQ